MSDNNDEAVATQPAEKSIRQREEEQLLDTLAEIGGKRVTDDDLLFQGRKMILPATMTARDAISYLKSHVEQEEEEHRFERTFRYRPWDGAAALQNALVKTFGTRGIGKAQWSFFGGKIPPEFITIHTGPDETTQVPWGEMQVPLLEGTIFLTGTMHPEMGQLFHLVVDCPRKHRAHVEGLFRLVEEELRSNSIYKGGAIDGQQMPEFLDLRGVDPAKVVYSDEVMRQLEANVWSLLRHTSIQEELGMPLKRAVLLEGPYGTGKTLAAFLTAQIAVENGWTFVYCRPGRDDLNDVMSTARLYQPAVVFFEDVDSIAGTDQPEQRDSVSQLLDLFDGIQAKGTKLLAILTTNHKERIHQGMVRPGRLDAMIHIGALDTNGIERMIRSSVPGHLLTDSLDVEAIGESMGVGTERGFLPAFVKEAIDRAMRYAVARDGGKPEVLDTEDFIGAAEGLRPQLDLMHGASEGTARDGLTEQFRKLAEDAVDGADVLRGGEPWAVIERNEKARRK